MPSCDFGLEVGRAKVELHWSYFLKYEAIVVSSVTCHPLVPFQSSLVEDLFFFYVKHTILVLEIVVSI